VHDLIPGFKKLLKIITLKERVIHIPSFRLLMEPFPFCAFFETLIISLSIHNGFVEAQQ